MVLHAATVTVLPPLSNYQKVINRVRFTSADERRSKRIKIVIVQVDMTRSVCRSCIRQLSACHGRLALAEMMMKDYF